MRKAENTEKQLSVYETSLGVTRLQNGTCRFAVSLPGVNSCTLLLFGKDKKIVSEKEMTRHSNGIFTTATDEHFESYVYSVEGERVTDPYATTVVGREKFGKRENEEVYCMPPRDLVKSVVHVKKFDEDALLLYKLHVRGFTADGSSGVENPGTFLGVTEKIRHIKKLGITGVVLMPAYDFDECSVPENINFWGYGGKNTFYFAPKASYATSPQKAEEEFGFMVNSLHEAGIKVFMEFLFEGGCSVSFVLDCLRHWVSKFDIDGFKIDAGNVYIPAIADDPYLSDRMFIVSNIGNEFAKKYKGRLLPFDDSFMKDIRRYIKGDEGMVPAFFEYMKNRDIVHGVRFITDNNGFTLNDLYSYDVKHNEDNGEYNRDGSDINYSWNCGTEGTTEKKKIRKLRLLMKKNLLTSLFLSGGVPMLLAGDEIGNTQNGNNNAWCQDNEIGYVNWDKDDTKNEIVNFIRALNMLRNSHPILSRRADLKENDLSGIGMPEISLHSDMPWMVDMKPYNRLAGIYFKDSSKDKMIMDDDLYIIYNMHWEPHEFKMPIKKDEVFEAALYTDKGFANSSDSVTVNPRSVVILKKK